VNPASDGFETCDCHSHVYGPYSKFPLSDARTFDPPESTIESLEATWKTCGVSRAVLIQGSAYGNDHRALLDGISRDPENRRGIAIVNSTISDAELNDLHRAGIRGVRFNWVSHLLQKRRGPLSLALSEAALLAKRILSLGWHIEVHVDPECLDMIERLEVAAAQIVVVDHMARLDGSLGLMQAGFQRLLNLLGRPNVWVKLSGPDRLVRREESLSSAMGFVGYLAQEVPDRCIWGLDWPHVNLSRTYSDASLCAFFDEAVSNLDLRMKILSENPARLYGFPTSCQVVEAIGNKDAEGVTRA
jgi:2-pyrone-4,6-dicarboxylate lactonase